HSARSSNGRRAGLRLPGREGQGDQSGRQGGFLQYRPAAIPRRKIPQTDVRTIPPRNDRSTIETGREEVTAVRSLAGEVKSMTRKAIAVVIALTASDSADPACGQL